MNFSLENKRSFRIILFLTLSLTLSLTIFLANPANAYVESPKKQMKRGIAVEDITCKAGLSLVIRTSGFPACVKSTTGDKLQKMGLVKIGFTRSEEIQIGSEEIQIGNSKEIQVIPASVGSVVNFYITDDDLNIAHRGIETVSTDGLLEFTINGVTINGPSSMVETGPDTGKFYGKLQLPNTVNGIPLSQNDIVLMKYFDASNYAGVQQTVVDSVPLTKSFAKVQTVGGGSRIGHEFIVRVYDPDQNRDSENEDHISLNQLVYKGKDGIETTLANPDFDANSTYLIETGPNTSIFEVEIKIPRKIDGKTVDIGDWYEIKYIDVSNPSNTVEKIILKGRIG